MIANVSRAGTAPQGAPRPLLSISIPTYNMGQWLRDLLEGIAEQIAGFGTKWPTDLVEVVVCDNHSSDDTAQIVASFSARIPRLVYHRHSANIGPDRNFLSGFEHATGTFSWLMGSDDVVEQGGLDAMLTLLTDNPGLCGMSVNRNARSFDLKTIIPEDAFPMFTGNALLRGPDQVFRTISYYIGYISGQVVRRTIWNQVVRDRPVTDFCNGYVHVYVIAEMLKTNPDWLVVTDRLVGWRADNDSFLAAGRYRRLAIDVLGFEQISAACFGRDSATYRSVRDTIATKHFRINVLTARARNEWDATTARRTRKLALDHYRRSLPFWIRTAPLLFAPDAIVKPIRDMKRKLRGTKDKS